MLLFIGTQARAEIQDKHRRDSIRLLKHKIRMDNPIFLGVEMSHPQFRYGWKAKGPWFGPSVMGWSGLLSVNFQRGLAEVQDSGKVYQARGYSAQIGVRIPFWSLSYQGFNIIPNLGFNVAWQSLEDKRRTYVDDGSYDVTQMGVSFCPGIILKLGPVVASVSYTANIGYNISEKNAYSVINYYPSFGLYTTSLPLLMAPKDFSATGLRHYKELVDTWTENSGISYWKKTEETTDYVKYKKEQIKWVKSTYADRYKKETVSCRDVRPFTYIGPRLNSTWFNGKQLEQATNMGVNAGFRYGMWWVNAFAETGKVYVKSPALADELFQVYHSASYPNLSGQFSNTKFGAQVGIELLARALKSDFKPFDYTQAKTIKSVTSFVGIIPFVGYGVTTLGSYTYNSPGGAADVADFKQRVPSKSVFDPATVSGSQAFVNFGGCFHFGAAVLGMDWYYYPKAKSLNSRQIFLGLNIPVVRLVRAMTVAGYIRKIQKIKIEEDK